MSLKSETYMTSFLVVIYLRWDGMKGCENVYIKEQKCKKFLA